MSNKPVTQQQLNEFKIEPHLVDEINFILANNTAELTWQKISRDILKKKHYPFEFHRWLFQHIFPSWPQQPETGIAWMPFDETANLTTVMKELGFTDYKKFHAWSFNDYPAFWEYIIKKLHIVFNKNPEKIVDLSAGIEKPVWLPGAKFNITDSCFLADANQTAIIYQSEDQNLRKISYGELAALTHKIANGLIQAGFKAGDAIAIDMPMNDWAVACYLGIIKMGGVVVSIADSFSKEEIATRLHIAQSKGIITQDFILRNNKLIPLYEKVVAADSPRAIVFSQKNKQPELLRSTDISWQDFLNNNDKFLSHPCDPMSHCNILFSSGTTGDPKAIPWNHTTPIKVASDSFFHQNIQENDVLAWPTNLGWMMGPWLIFAALINKATIGLFDGLPSGREFGKFIENAKVTMLGLVPTLVATWRQSRCMENLNWENIKVFSSTGECSNPEDMLYLMSLANYKPIIEYCGGTEIGGAYVTSTVIENNAPSIFTTPTLGLNFILLDEEKQLTDVGEVALIPPSIGLSTEILNADQYTVYYQDMPLSPDGKVLRRHGDQLHQFSNGNYCVLGRIDDTMNLGGIKISSAEIERSLVGIPDIIETAAIAYSPSGHGPSHLVIFAAAKNELDPSIIKNLMQKKINLHSNPLFKIENVILLPELPKTASNKIMRRVLRKKYLEEIKGSS
jgi:acetyl-CoA synthetase